MSPLRKIKMILLAVPLILCTAVTSWAIPTLQLDILGGTYDTTTETIVTTNSAFTLYALLNPGEGSIEDTYYISTALVPKTVTPGEYGSFTFDGSAVSVTSGMVYGTPPIASAELPSHGIFQTYFQEFSFNFSGSKTLAYNSQENPGQLLIQNPNGTMYYQSFAINTANLAAGYGIHIDLYSQKFKNGDLSLSQFAPFSHDAEYTQVPEPSTMILLGLGLVGLAGARKKLNWLIYR